MSRHKVYVLVVVIILILYVVLFTSIGMLIHKGTSNNNQEQSSQKTNTEQKLKESLTLAYQIRNIDDAISTFGPPWSSYTRISNNEFIAYWCNETTTFHWNKLTIVYDNHKVRQIIIDDKYVTIIKSESEYIQRIIGD